MLVSAIIPSYNRSGFLEKCLESVAGQTRPCDEIILVDDGSNDGTKQLVAEWNRRGRQPVHYYFQQNQGAAAARNTGIRMAQGDLLCFLDSDDCWQPEKVELQLRAMQANPGFAISHTKEIWYRRGQLLNQKKKHQPPHGEIFAACLAMCVVGMSTVMIRWDVFERHGMFDESLPCCEDYEFWLRIAPCEHFLLIDAPLTVKQGGREDQLSVRYRAGMDRYRIQALSKLLENRELSASDRAAALLELEKKCQIYGRGCLKHGRPEEAEHFFALPGRYIIA